LAAIRMMQRVRTTGSAAPARLGGHRRPARAVRGRPEKLVAATPDITLAERRRFGVVAGLTKERRFGLNRCQVQPDDDIKECSSSA
jgi:hypothetical protein